MACGTPVAAYPEDGPREVLGQNCGGILHQDLRQAWYRALTVGRPQARARALAFTWAHAARQFAGHLVPVRAAAPAQDFVTPLSSIQQIL